MNSTSFYDLGKRKIIDNNDNNNSYTIIPPLKKQKIYYSTYNRNFCFPSLICVDYYSNYFTLFIDYNKNVFSVGYSDYSSHGYTNMNIFPVKQIQDLTDIKMIDCGNCHSICLDYNGYVYSFGRNNFGQLGIGKDNNEVKQTHIPHKINIPPCKQISCGNNYSICLSEDNTLYSFGSNDYGQLGLGNNKSYNFPQLIPDLNNIEYIVCGGCHVLCKLYENEYYSWGDYYNGQLGQGNNDKKSCNKPIQCLHWPDNIISIKSASHHSLLLTSKGQVYSFGSNNYGQLGINIIIKSINIPTLIKDIPEIQRIECGYNHSMCIDINDNLWLFGHNYYGQLGLGDKEIRYKPIQHPTLSNIIDVSSGGDHAFVKTIDNKIYAFGSNYYSQLGIKTSKKQLTPIQVLKDNEDIWYSFIGKSKQKSARK